MGFQQAVASGFSKYVTFSGRACRSEFWYFVLFVVIGTIVCMALDYALNLEFLNILFSLATFLPSIAVTARRLHDIGRSGWWQLLVLVPLVGFIWLIVWFCRRGEPMANRFGPPPILA